MNEIIQDEILCRRFDAVQSNHIARLWKRTARGFNNILNSDHLIFWDCEEVKVPFQNIEEANIIMLLSEGNHPTDGHDYLFLLINHIVNKSNLFSQRLHEFHRKESADDSFSMMTEVHPKFVIHGNNAAIAISSLSFYSLDDLASLMESVWCEEQGLYDLNKISPIIFEEMIGFLNNRPAVKNPSSFLREKFQFRDDNLQCLSQVDSTQASYLSSTGQYFVHIQDLQLFEAVMHGLMKLGLDKPSLQEGLTRTFGVNFYQADYEPLRSILEGLRTSMGLLTADVLENCQTFRQAISNFVQESDECANLHSFGFPMMTDMQLKLILSLKVDHLFDFAVFLGHQLASEAYLFSNLALCMTDPLKEEVSRSIVSNFTQNCFNEVESKVEEAVKSLDDFVNNALSFYEAQICEAAFTSTNKSLRIYLMRNNFCDEATFPFFSMIPEEVTIHNYVSLRQLLHQAKLAMLWRNENSASAATNPGAGNVGKDIEMTVASADCSNANISSSFAKPRRGYHWLWTADSSPDVIMEEEDGVDATENCTIHLEKQIHEGLWFQGTSAKAKESIEDKINTDEVGLPTSMEFDTVDVDEVFHTSFEISDA